MLKKVTFTFLLFNKYFRYLMNSFRFENILKYIFQRLYWLKPLVLDYIFISEFINCNAILVVPIGLQEEYVNSVF